jgi:microcystin-dependent protein
VHNPEGQLKDGHSGRTRTPPFAQPPGAQGDNIISADNVKLDNAALITSGLFSARPTAATAGALNYYFATDVSQLFLSTGSAWVEVAPGAGTVPVGTVASYLGSSDPTDRPGWVVADGRSLSTTDYPAAYALWGSTYNTQDGQSAPGAGLFRIPRMGGLTVVGVGSNSGLTTRTLGQRLGFETHQLDASQIPPHGHPHTLGTAAAGSHAHGGATQAADRSLDHLHGPPGGTNSYWANVNTGGGWSVAGPGGGLFMSGATGGMDRSIDHLHAITADGNHSHTITGSISNNTGGGGSHPNMQPSICFNVIGRVS